MKLKKEFAEFYKYIRIDKETDVLIEKRGVLQSDIENKLPNELADHGISITKSDIRMFDQGSYKYNTTIFSDVVDRDVAVMIPLDTTDNPDPRKIKGYLRDAINISSRTVEIKEPCVRAVYHENGQEWLHIDLPLYAQDGTNVYLARGKATSDSYVWEEADPDGLNEDLCGKINGNDQLRRIICYIKKWKNEKYANSTRDHEIPPSIGLTYLACDCFSHQTSNGYDDDLLAFQKTMQNIKNKFSLTLDTSGNITGASISRHLPVKPYTDVFEKMRNSSASYMLTFYNRLCAAVENLTIAVNVESDHDAGTYVQRVVGSDFEVPPKQAASATTQNKREHSFG